MPLDEEWVIAPNEDEPVQPQSWELFYEWIGCDDEWFRVP